MRPTRSASLLCLAVFSAVVVACSGASSSTSSLADSATPVDAGGSDATSDGRLDARSGSSASITGFTARGASFAASKSRVGEALLDIVFADSDDVCGAPRSAQLTKVLHLTVRTSGAMEPGTYPVIVSTVLGGSGDAPESTVVVWAVSDVGGDLCTLSSDDEAGYGGVDTITLTRVSDDVVEGTVNFTLKKAGSKVVGSFRATSCPAAQKKSFACPLSL